MLKAELEREVSPTSLCYVVWTNLNISLIFFRENNNKQLIVQETCSLVSSKKNQNQFSLFSFTAKTAYPTTESSLGACMLIPA